MTVNEFENNRESNGLNGPNTYDYLAEDDDKDLLRDEPESSYLFDDDETESDEMLDEEDYDDSGLYSSSSLFDEIEEEESEGEEESGYYDYEDSEEPNIFDEIEEEEDVEEFEAETAGLRSQDPVFVPLEEVKPEVEEKHVDGPVFVPLESANTVFENLEAGNEEPEETVIFEDEPEELEELPVTEEEPEDLEEAPVAEDESEEELEDELEELEESPVEEEASAIEDELEEQDEPEALEEDSEIEEEPEEQDEIEELEESPAAEEPEDLEEVPAAEDESEEEPEDELEELEEPEKSYVDEGKFSLCKHIIEKLPTNSLVRSYLKKQDEGILKDISYTIEQARLAWVIDGKDKMFTIPETDISVIVCSSLNDPMAKIQRQIHAAALMIGYRKTSWNILFVTFDGDQKLSEAVSQEISRKTFTDWQWKRAQSLADIITNK